jgi:hypothetical protein
MNEVKIAVTPAANAAVGPAVSFVGKTKFNNKDYTATSQPASLVGGCRSI